MMLRWLFGSRKSKLKKPVTKQELIRLDGSLWQAQHLTSDQREQLVRWSRVFISEKHWEGCGGLRVTDEMKWCIASMAGMMVLAYPKWYFDRTATILIYPQPYTARVEPQQYSNSFNPVLGGEFRRAGETIYNGPVVLNWSDIEGARLHHNEGNNLVVHEFAHQLDMINGSLPDGFPPLPNNVNENEWRRSFRAEFQVARKMVEAGHTIYINDYGLSHECEFFAVASEYYFQTPNELADYHPMVHQLLQDFYITDTAKQFGA
jgi:MtfA peptidase